MVRPIFLHLLKRLRRTRSTIDVDTTNANRPTLRVRVSIDDKLAWTYNIDGIAVKISGANAIGTFVASGIRDVFGKIGIRPTSWF